MNYVVVPLSAAGPGSKDVVWIGLTVAVHITLIGKPIALGSPSRAVAQRLLPAVESE